MRLEASLDGQIESKWRLEARLEAKLRLEGDETSRGSKGRLRGAKVRLEVGLEAKQ